MDDTSKIQPHKLTGEIQPRKLMAIGMGSLMDLCPEKLRAEDFIVTDPEERMRRTWKRVGRSMWRALDEYQTITQEK